MDQKDNIKSNIANISSSIKPWWSEAPNVARICASLIVAPLKMLALIADTLVSLSFLIVFGVIGLWWGGYIPDDVVSNFIGKLGDKALAIIQSSGVI